MRHARYSRPILLAAAVWSAAAFGIRTWILKRSPVVNHLLMAERSALLWSMLFLLVGFVGLAALCLRLNRLPGTDACFDEAGLGVIPALLAALLLLLGCIFRLTAADSALDLAQRLTELLGLVSALLMAVTVLFRDRLGRLAFWTRLPLALYAGVTLVLRFRAWSHDPMIIDFAPQLLTVVSAMLAATLLTAFPLGVGHRRSTVLFGLATFVFVSMAIPDYLFAEEQSLAELMIFLGLALWGATHACLLLRAQVQDETAPEPPAEAEKAAE